MNENVCVSVYVCFQSALSRPEQPSETARLQAAPLDLFEHARTLHGQRTKE